MMIEREKIRFDLQKLSRKTALAGLLRRELAERADVSAATISAAFKGKSLGIRAARSIAKALNSTISALASDDKAAVGAA